MPAGKRKAADLVGLGEALAFGEARQVADLLDSGKSVRSALQVLGPGRLVAAHRALEAAGFGPDDADALRDALYVLAGGARQAPEIQSVWTMPQGLVFTGAETHDAVLDPDSAKVSITCATMNLQWSSELVKALKRAQQRGVHVRLFMDTKTADGEPRGGKRSGPTTQAVADDLAHSEVFRTVKYQGWNVCTHAKYLIVDHRLVFVTSANHSLSAERYNVELGLRVDDTRLARQLEAQTDAAIGPIYERVWPSSSAR